MVGGRRTLAVATLLALLAASMPAQAGPLADAEAVVWWAEAAGTAPVWANAPPEFWTEYDAHGQPWLDAAGRAWDFKQWSVQAADGLLVDPASAAWVPGYASQIAGDPAGAPGGYIAFAGEVAQPFLGTGLDQAMLVQARGNGLVGVGASGAESAIEAAQPLRRAAGDPDDSPQGVNRLTAAMSEQTTCMLYVDRNVWCMEIGSAGEWFDRAGDVVDLDYGWMHGSQELCFLRTSGNVDCWEWEDRPTARYTGGDVVALGPGSCLVFRDGDAHCETTYAGGDAVGAASAEGVDCYLLATGDVQCLGEQGPWRYTGADATQVHVFSRLDYQFKVEVCVLRGALPVSCAVFANQTLEGGYLLTSEGEPRSLTGTQYGVCVLTTGPDHPCVGDAGYYSGCSFGDPCNVAGPPRDPYPDLVPTGMAFGPRDSCWFYEGGRSYCDHDGDPHQGVPDRVVPYQRPCIDSGPWICLD